MNNHKVAKTVGDRDRFSGNISIRFVMLDSDYFQSTLILHVTPNFQSYRNVLSYLARQATNDEWYQIAGEAGLRILK